MLPNDPKKHAEYRQKIREARARQHAPVPKGTKFSDEHRAAISASAKASTTHRSKHQSGASNTAFKRGWFLDKNGYRVKTLDGKQFFEHRIVMSDMIGRELLPQETVHHKNGQRDDNRPSNLELWSSRNPKGQRIEDKLQWAQEIIALYDPSAFRPPIDPSFMSARAC